jgi:hypothetical protein
MATTHKSHTIHHNGARTTNHGHASKTDPRRSRGLRSQQRLSQLIAFGRNLPNQIQAQYKTNPTLAVATIGGVAFALGALVGSKLGRLALAAAVPYAIKRVFEGDVGEDFGQFARELFGSVEGEGQGDA